MCVCVELVVLVLVEGSWNNGRISVAEVGAMLELVSLIGPLNVRPVALCYGGRRFKEWSK